MKKTLFSTKSLIKTQFLIFNIKLKCSVIYIKNNVLNTVLIYVDETKILSRYLLELGFCNYRWII